VSLPDPSSYIGAVRNYYALAFQGDPILLSGRPAPGTDPRRPFITGGGFALIIRVEGCKDGKAYAVRFFKRPPEQLSERYRAICRALAGAPSPHLVAMEYREGQGAGVLVNSSWYPYIRMEWVPGTGLKAAVLELARQGQQQKLRRLADDWLEAALSLKASAIGHGDLHPGNILLDDRGTIRLIDYDSLWVPELVGLASVGVGLPGYQHPGRQVGHFDLHVGDFAALVIYVSILGAAVLPHLVQRTGLEEEEILFSAADLQHPEGSVLFRLLEAGGDPALSHVAGVLRAACQEPFAQIPRLEAVAEPVLRERRLKVQLQQALFEEDDNRLVELALPVPGRLEDWLGEPERARVALAVERVRRYAALRLAMEAGDDAAIAAAWHEDLLGPCRWIQGWEHRRVRKVLDRAARAEELKRCLAAGDESGVVRLYDEAIFAGSNLLTDEDRASAQAEIRTHHARRLLEQLLNAGDEEAVAAAWEEWQGRVLPERLGAGIVDRVAAIRQRLARARNMREIRRAEAARLTHCRQIEEAAARGDHQAVLETYARVAGATLPSSAAAQAVREAMLRSLAAAAPECGPVVQEDGFITVPCSVPEGPPLLRVGCRAFIQPEDPQDPRVPWVEFSAREVRERGGFTIPAPKGRPLYIRVFACWEFQGERLCSLGALAACKRKAQAPAVVRYWVTTGGVVRRRRRLEVVAEGERETPEMLVVVAEGHTPQHQGDGEVAASLRFRKGDPRRRQVDLAPWDGRQELQVALFARNEEDAADIRFVPG
jgi:hypothetical protein